MLYDEHLYGCTETDAVQWWHTCLTYTNQYAPQIYSFISSSEAPPLLRLVRLSHMEKSGHQLLYIRNVPMHDDSHNKTVQLRKFSNSIIIIVSVAIHTKMTYMIELKRIPMIIGLKVKDKAY